jgi:hypothetical protein
VVLQYAAYTIFGGAMYFTSLRDWLRQTRIANKISFINYIWKSQQDLWLNNHCLVSAGLTAFFTTLVMVFLTSTPLSAAGLLSEVAE